MRSCDSLLKAPPQVPTSGHILSPRESRLLTAARWGSKADKQTGSSGPPPCSTSVVVSVTIARHPEALNPCNAADAERSDGRGRVP